MDIKGSIKTRYEATVYIVTAIYLILVTLSTVLYEGDTLWHIRAGEQMLKRAAVLRTDVFSWTAYGVKWTAHEWLYEVIIAAIYDRCGFIGLQILTVIFSLIYGIAAIYMARKMSICWLPFVLLLEIVIKTQWCIRPHTAALAIFAMLLVLLTEGRLVKADKRNLAAVFVLFMVWANIHSSVTIGLIVLAIFIIYQKADGKHIIAAIAGATATPQLLGIYKYSWDASSNQKIINTIIEWQSPNFHEIWNIYAVIFALATILLIGSKWDEIKIKGKKVVLPSLGNVLIVLGLITYLKSVRHISILTLMIAAGIRANGAVLPITSIQKKKIMIAISIAMLASTATYTIFHCDEIIQAANIERQLETDSVNKAVEFIKTTGRTERVLNEYNIGDYMIWHGIRPFIDGRADMYVFSRPEIWSDYISSAYMESARPEEILDKYGIRHIIFRKSRSFAKYLQKIPGIKKVYENESVIIYDYKT